MAQLFLRKTAVMQCKDEKQFTRDMAEVVNKARGATIKLSQVCHRSQTSSPSTFTVRGNDISFSFTATVSRVCNK